MLPKKPLDHRYEVVKIMINAGNIPLFTDIFHFIPKTIVARDCHMNLDTWNARLDDLEEFILKPLVILADNIGVELEIIVALVWKEIREKRRTDLLRNYK